MPNPSANPVLVKRASNRHGWLSRLVGVSATLAAVFALAMPQVSIAASKARFKASLDSSSLTVARNASSNVTVLVTRVGTFDGPIKLSSSKRTGLTITFDENPLTGDDTDLFVAAGPTAAIGSTTLTISASDGRTTAKLRLKVKVTAGVPGATTVPATSTPPSTVAATTVAATTVATASSTSTTTLVATTTSSTTTTLLNGGVKVTSTSGNLVILRKVSQAAPCAPNGSVNVKVTVSLSNTGTSGRLLSVVNPGTCVESPFPAPLAAGSIAGAQVPIGALIVARSQSTAGNPIRTVLYVKGAASFDVAGTMRVAYQCTGVAEAQPLTMADGDQVVITTPAGSSCKVFTADNNPNSVSDNSGLPLDGTAQVPGLPGTCSVATATTPIPAPAGCYAEFTVTT